MNILTIPGFMLDADMWRETRAHLSQFGSVRDADTTQDATIEAIAARAVATLVEPTIVVGFSMGGYVAREIYRQAPERVAALILIATSSAAGGGTGGSAPSQKFTRLGRVAVARSLHPDHRSDELILRIQEMSARLGGDVFQRQASIPRLSDTDRLSDINCPTLVVAAAQDELRTMEESEVLAAGIERSVFVVIEHSGHMIPIEQPAELLKAIDDFLSTLTSSGNLAHRNESA